MNRMQRIAAAVAFLLAHAGSYARAETMTDRCSSDVAFVLNYDAPPNGTGGTILLRRDSSGYTPWTNAFKVNLNSDGFVRWWCRSTTGNWIDPGTWRVSEWSLGTTCSVNDSGNAGCKPNASVKKTSSAWNGWTAERSRCDSRTPWLQARLGPNRLIETRCLDNPVGTTRSALSTDTGPSACYNAVQGNVAWDYNNNRTWADANVSQLCGTATNSEQPAWCFLHVMFDGVDWGGGTRWDWQNAANLCKSSTDASARIGCFEYVIATGNTWQNAINFCVQNT